MQEKRNSSVFAMEWHLSCSNPSKLSLFSLVTKGSLWDGKSAVEGTRAFLEKTDTISRRIVPTWCLYAFMNKLAIRFWMDGLNLNVILMFLPICHTTAIALTWQPVPEPINGISGTWLSCFATCDWLRALVHLHCDVMITTSTTKTWWSCRLFGVDLPCLWKKICHQNTMLMRWKVYKFKDEDLKILGR